MAVTNTSISLASLDFDTLKTNLKNFLRSQSAFKDYDYDGSNMNVLLDVLSYNTYLNAFYLNMGISEMFLDSAQLRSSVVSHAKMLNYIPRSKRSATASINLSIQTTNAISLTIPKGTTFTGTNGFGNFVFSTDKTQILTSGNFGFTSNNLTIYQGSYTQDAFVIDYTNETQRFTLIDPNVDTESLSVIVSENDGQDINEFKLAENLYGLSGNSNVYFLQTDIDGRYQIQFGDNIFGRRPLSGAVVVAEYRTCAGSDANEIDSFILENDLAGINSTNISNTSVVTVVRSLNGANAESIESVRYNAPRHFQTQERAVTTQDYVDLIQANFPDVESVSAYGGETISEFGDVEYGKVFVSCSTYAGTNLTDSRKKDVLAFLSPRTALGITPYMIDPEFLYITLVSKVHIDFNQTSLTSSQMQASILQTISAFNDDNLKKFGYNFRMSSLMSTIDNLDPSILSNETTSYMYKKYIDLSPIVPEPLRIDFHLNPIKPGSILSNQFSSGGKNYIYTDYIPGVNNTGGNLYRLEKTVSPTSTLNYSVAGSVDYQLGVISIVSSIYDRVPVGGLRIFAAPVNQDIYSARNNILNIDTATGVSVSVVSG